MTVSFVDLLKRRVLPIAFICGMAVIIQSTCNKQPTRTHATIVLDLGELARDVKSVDAELTVNDEVISQYHRKALPDLAIGTCQFAVAMPADDGSLRLDIEIGGATKHLVRRIHADEGATIRIPLAADLAPTAAAP